MFKVGDRIERIETSIIDPEMYGSKGDRFTIESFLSIKYGDIVLKETQGKTNLRYYRLVEKKLIKSEVDWLNAVQDNFKHGV